MITQDQLKELLHYDPETGDWAWRANGRPAGTICRSRRSPPYRRISIDRRKYGCGPLAWLYMTGKMPVGEIDHWDRNSLNDRWENLRDVTRFQNEANKGHYRNNKLGLKGVCRHHGRFVAAIRRNGRRVHLGVFDFPDDAAAAYAQADAEMAV